MRFRAFFLHTIELRRDLEMIDAKLKKVSRVVNTSAELMPSVNINVIF